jgi:hypothetical protein
VARNFIIDEECIEFDGALENLVKKCLLIWSQRHALLKEK